MKDAFERRALLLHLGDALQAISAALAADAKHHTLHHLLNAHAELGAHEWLAAVSAKMKTTEFAKRASASFEKWPVRLLDEQVDYSALALAVQDNLFADNPSGWRAYIDAMKREVEWFGDGLPFAEAAEELAQMPKLEVESAQAPNDVDTPTADADIERVDEVGDQSRESVESDGRLYPSWPWKPGV
ncbi:hypothetical protein [Burkholderia sp. Ac-20365]|uniref:hypothetical protein n=1 Tax=Burkholderia sp. Ac-20365 TaxID=2703897 RepID=UPI00197C8A3C|nr:hypothetical protein [Burkholderia sp. Ac-20365]MBN3764783.1 hypothetical protein [Burkholderia sp. Ac-20365]